MPVIVGCDLAHILFLLLISTDAFVAQLQQPDSLARLFHST
jgi:hypothetical protein